MLGRSARDRPTLMATPVKFYGDQPVNEIFAESLSEVGSTCEFAPFQNYSDTQSVDALTTALGAGTSMADALDGVLGAIVAYEKDEGFTIV